MSFVWNGSKLENFTEDNFDIKFRSNAYQHFTYCKITYNDISVCCRYQKMNDPISCIYDEIMTLFNIQKNGTHYTIINGKYYIFFKLNYNNKLNKISEDILLSFVTKENKIKFNKDIILDIQKLYLVRDMLGVYTNDGHICIRKVKYKTKSYNIVLGHRIPSMNESIYTYNSDTITDEAYKIWFTDEDNIRQITRKVCPVNSDSVDAYIHNMHIKMKKIVERIHKPYIYIIDIIKHRMQDRLSLLLNE